MKLLKRTFYLRDPQIVAKELLGKILVRTINSEKMSGIIVETEAYLEKDDEAAHSYKGETKSNSSLFLDGGHAYIYSIHRYFCFNTVCLNRGQGGGVLIRAIEPLSGVSLMKKYRNVINKDLTNGPGKLCMALNLNRHMDGIDLTNSDSEIKIYDSGVSTNYEIETTTRIGISKNKDSLLRFYIKENPFVSRK